MRVHHNVCCGIDVHKRCLTACLMWGPAGQEPEYEIRRFGTMTSDLKKLGEWLKQAHCEIAAMESTGSYWKPVWNVLEDYVKLILANANHVRALPGEKTDQKDGKRLAGLLRHGLIRPSFVPPRDIRQLRDLTRYRSKLLGNGASERNRIQKVLEDANIKLGSVLSDVFGVSGQRLLKALFASDTLEVDQMAKLVHWKLEPKIEQIKKALEGKLTDHHRFLIELSLNHMELIEKQVIRLDQEIDRRLIQHQQSLDLLESIPGLGPNSSKSILSEIGPDMSAYPDGQHLASWSAICPGNNESAGKKFSGKTRKGNPHLRASLVDCAWGATRKKGSRFRAQYYIIKSRRGSKRAIVAVAHSLLLTIYAVLQTRQPYSEPEPPPLSETKRIKKASDLCRKLRRLGFDIALKEKTKTLNNESFS
jgi:transposase